MSIPVYILTGFLDSGKTSFIKNTLLDPVFTEDEKTLLIACEDGEEEYDEKFLADANCELLMIDSKDDYKGGRLKKALIESGCNHVFLEYNGMWEPSLIEQELPHDWEIYQIICVINAQTYKGYVKNMGPKLIEHVRLSELVVFNRCTPQLNEYIRSTGVNAMNPKAAIYLEDEQGNSENYRDGLPLPFDINAPVIELKDEDFGAWFMDAISEPQKYEGKEIEFTGLITKQPEDEIGRFMAGRFGMVCCAEDISYLGFFCEMDGAESLCKTEDYAKIKGKIKVEYYPQFDADAPVIEVSSYTICNPPEEEVVFFR